MNHDYGERRCPVCKTLFEAAYPGQVCCSGTCKKTRRLVLRRESDALYRLRRKGELETLRARVAELEEARKELEQLHAEQEALRKERNLMQAPLRRTVEHPVNRAAPAVDTSGWDFCQRMQLRARLLPCGEREECEGCTRLGGNRRTLSGPLEERVCPVCGKTFAPEKSNSKYCSPICRKRAGKAREKQVGKG